MMIKKLYLFTIFGLLIIGSMAIVVNYGTANAQSSVANGLNTACDSDKSNPYCADRNQSSNPLPGTIRKVTDIVAMVGGIIAVIIIIISGLRYITSSGDPQKVASAKNTIIYALVGVVVIVMAQVIIIFVINHLL